jgi:two-component system response regulator YesN
MKKRTRGTEGDGLYRILVVDDEQIERDGVCYLLNKYKYPFACVQKNNGREAAEYLRGNRADIILTDIKMPFMDGLELCRFAKELYPEIRLVLLTAYNDFEYTKQAIQVKADEYIMKPVVVEEFRRVMDGLTEELNRQEKELLECRVLARQLQSADGTMRGRLTNILMEKAKLARPEEAGEALLSEKKLVRETMRVIEQEYARDIHPAELADRAGVSRGYLSAVFKRETGLSLVQCITMMKMDRAQSLLLGSSMKIGDIALAVGYSDFSYFGMIFRKTFGVTPAQYRNGKLTGEAEDENEKNDRRGS